MNLNRVFAIVFLLIISIPLIGTLVGLKSNLGLNEKRRLATFDETGGNLSLAITNYYNDNFFLRDHLIKSYQYVMSSYFSVMPHAKVVKGKDNWLFYSNKYDGDPISDYRGIYRLSDVKLNILFEMINDRVQWCNKNNIVYLLVVVPNKHTVYPEYLPSYIIKENISNREQITQLLKTKLSMNYLDLTEILLGLKKTSDYLLYKPKDTHWNGYASYWAYREMVSRINAFIGKDDLIPLTLNVVSNINNVTSDDLSLMIGEEPSQYNKDVIVEVKEKYYGKELNFDEVKKIKNIKKITSYYKNKNGKGKLLILGDSFTRTFLPFIKEGYKDTVFIGSEGIKYFPKDEIKKFKPNVLIQQIVERYLNDY